MRDLSDFLTQTGSNTDSKDMSLFCSFALSRANAGQLGQNGTSGTAPFVNQILNYPEWDNLGQAGTRKIKFWPNSVPPGTLQLLPGAWLAPTLDRGYR